MPSALHAIDYLSAKTKAATPAVCVVFGDEPFLKRLVLTRLRGEVLEGDDGELSFTALDGDDATTRDVFDCLATVALFGGGRRLVLVEAADDFVTRNRAALEDYVARPKPSGVLVLEVNSWPSNTKLYKAVAASGLPIECKAPTAGALVKWLVERARTTHQAKLDRGAAELLVEIVGPELGLLDQELAKLAVSVSAEQSITPELIQQLVGGWRVKTTWDMLDAAAAGNAAQAIVELDRLILAGENPIGLLAQIGSSLRRFATAARLVEQAEAAGRRTSLRQVLETAGVKSFVVSKAESQMRQLGRRRAGQLHRWLLEADLALKGAGSSGQRPRIVLEQLVARMSKQAAGAKTS